MDLTHLHLLLNHVPTVGMVIALGLFLLSLATRSDHIQQASLALFLGIAMLTIPTYVTGNAAAQAICKSPTSHAPCQDTSLSRGMIEAHEGAAMWGMALMEFVGAFAWLGLWQFRRAARVPRWNLAVVLLLSLMTFAAMARAADLGGEIHHPEVRGPVVTAPAEPVARELGEFIVSVKWVWPTCETLHFIGLSLLFGVAALVDLRMLGMLKSVPFHALHRMLPWGILGFGLNAITGMLFFIGAPQQYTENPVFEWKLALMMLTALNVLYFTVLDEPWAIQAGDDAPLTAKAVAVSALILVLGVLYCGRMLPFLGNAF
jgi:uncharacterized membrane protein